MQPSTSLTEARIPTVPYCSVEGGRTLGCCWGGEWGGSAGSMPCSGSTLLEQPWEGSNGHKQLRDGSPRVTFSKAWVSQEIQECLVRTVTEGEMGGA